LPKLRGSIEDCLNLLFVSSASTVVAVHRQPDFFFTRIRVFVEQRLGRRNGTRGAVSTLAGAVPDKSFLKDVRVSLISYASYGRHDVSVGFRGQGQA
jgi:hypothetical protein